MSIGALGLIEVKGYLGAIVAADIAVKSASVKLLNIESVRSGLRTIQLTGDVSAVTSAVEAVVRSIQNESYYISSHVIPRIDIQTEKILQSKRKINKSHNSKERLQSDTGSDLMIKDNEEGSISSKENLIKKVTLDPKQFSNDNDQRKFKREDLEKLKVVELRRMAYKEENIGLTKKEIKFGNKTALIDALIKL